MYGGLGQYGGLGGGGLAGGLPFGGGLVGNECQFIFLKNKTV